MVCSGVLWRNKILKLIDNRTYILDVLIATLPFNQLLIIATPLLLTIVISKYNAGTILDQRRQLTVSKSNIHTFAMGESDLTLVRAESSNEPSKNNIESTTVHPVIEASEESTKSSWGRYLVGLVWDSVEGDARNRRYVQKLDSFLL
jgi:hypothetical protein